MVNVHCILGYIVILRVETYVVRSPGCKVAVLHNFIRDVTLYNVMYTMHAVVVITSKVQ